jgi:hypothetical protein
MQRLKTRAVSSSVIVIVLLFALGLKYLLQQL